MFIRKKKNISGSISVQILEKQGRKNKLIKSIGVSKDEGRIGLLVRKAYLEISKIQKQEVLDFDYSQNDKNIFNFVDENIRIYSVGANLVLGSIFDSIGFNKIKDPLFKKLVISRIAYPVSKLKTTEYLERHLDDKISIQSVYRFLDKLHENYQEKIEQISYEYTKKILKKIAVVFYDMTTLYFDIKEEDGLRKIGFSKDGKFQRPQIMLGLLVGEDGYPIGYDIFEGNTFEGKTMIPFIERLQKKYGFSKPIVIADSGLLSKKNIADLKEKKYKFIIGARIKNESNLIKDEILKKTKNLKHGDNISLEKEDCDLIVSYSSQRAKKDKLNREKGLRKLKITIASGKLTKDQINNRGYNKFLRLKNEIEVELDEEKIENDKNWDGLKGYLSNTGLSDTEVIENYSHLWKIEKAFRISKNDLKIRPIFHFRKERIEAHICLSFVAYTIYKELERLLKVNEINLSITKAIELLETIYEMEFVLPDSQKTVKKLVNLKDKHKELLRVTRC